MQSEPGIWNFYKIRNGIGTGLFIWAGTRNGIPIPWRKWIGIGIPVWSLNKVSIEGNGGGFRIIHYICICICICICISMNIFFRSQNLSQICHLLRELFDQLPLILEYHWMNDWENQGFLKMYEIFSKIGIFLKFHKKIIRNQKSAITQKLWKYLKFWSLIIQPQSKGIKKKDENVFS